MTLQAILDTAVIAAAVLIILGAGLWSLMAPALAASDDDGGVSE